jgi:hypothetical protein
VDGPAPRCLKCGSTRRSGFAFADLATVNVTVGSPEAVAKEPDSSVHGGSLRKPARERRVGMSLTVEDGIERFRRREIDRQGDWYEETVFNPDGSEYHHEAHPLREHKGHGSAKVRIDR